MMAILTNEPQSFLAIISVIVTAALPVSELRGAIPLAIFKFNQPPLLAFSLAVLGNLIPALPLLLFLRPVARFFHRFWLFARFFDWLFKRTRRRARLVEKYEALGLILFVAIPLPMTGLWTGCLAATLFKLRLRYALPAIIAGVIIAGLVVTQLTLAGKMLLLNI